MAFAISNAETSAASGFTAEQQNYLSGFMAGAVQRMYFVGHTATGRITNDPGLSSTGNVAAAPDEELFFNTPVGDLCAEERWKFESDPLDAWEALLEHARENRSPDAEHRYRFKFHGLFYVAPAEDSFMLRLRIPAGVLSTSQLRGIVRTATAWGNGRLDLTTRANIQLRGFEPRNIVDVLQTVRRLGLSARGTGADNIRNITASPLAGIDSSELIDVRPYADALENYIANSRDLYGLPRKFNIAFDGGGSIASLAETNDIGFMAVRVPDGASVPAGIYFRVLLCGITGHRQFASDCGLLLRPEELVAVAAAMVRVFAENGDRTDRKKARLKYLIDRRGLPWFLSEVEKKLAFPVLHVAASEYEPRPTVNRVAHLGTHAQVQPGCSYVGVAVPVGLLQADQALAIAAIADQYGSGEIRLTVWQNLILPDIAEADVPAVIAALHAAGLDHEAGTVMTGTVACTGSAGCRFAAADTKRHAVEIARTLDAAFPILDQPVNLHVTGCHHSCAQHYIGDIGLMSVKVGGEEGYQLSLGGGSDQAQTIARTLFPGLTVEQVKTVLANLFTSYLETRHQEETLLSWCARYNDETLRALCGEAVRV